MITDFDYDSFANIVQIKWYQNFKENNRYLPGVSSKTVAGIDTAVVDKAVDVGEGIFVYYFIVYVIRRDFANFVILIAVVVHFSFLSIGIHTIYLRWV